MCLTLGLTKRKWSSLENLCTLEAQLLHESTGKNTWVQFSSRSPTYASGGYCPFPGCFLSPKHRLKPTWRPFLMSSNSAWLPVCRAVPAAGAVMTLTAFKDTCMCDSCPVSGHGLCIPLQTTQKRIITTYSRAHITTVGLLFPSDLSCPVFPIFLFWSVTNPQNSVLSQDILRYFTNPESSRGGCFCYNQSYPLAVTMPKSSEGHLNKF